MVDGHRLLCQWPFRVCFVVGFSCRRKEFGRNQGVVRKAGSVRGYRVWSQQISHQNRHRFSAILFCVSIHAPLRASPAMVSMWLCTLKLDEEKSKHVVFALQTCFWPAFLHWSWYKPQQSCGPAREGSNRYDLTGPPYFWLANHNDWSRHFAISSLPVLVLWVGLQKHLVSWIVLLKAFLVTSWI
jgi:hypothetical protein